jgi:hypothetical protein
VSVNAARLLRRIILVDPVSNFFSSELVRKPARIRHKDAAVLASPATSWGSHCRQGTGASMMTATADGGS